MRGNVEWPALDLQQYIEVDANPIAVCQRAASPQELPILVFCNAALRGLEYLKSRFNEGFLQQARGFEQDLSPFQRWVNSRLGVRQSGASTTHIWDGFVWASNDLEDRWVVFTGIRLPVQDAKQHEGCIPAVQPKAAQNGTNGTNGHGVAKPAITIEGISPAPNFLADTSTDHQKLVRDFDWASTPLGPINTWNSQLVQIVNLCLINTDAAAVFWGPELTSVYNEAFIQIIGQKHPKLMGLSPKDVFVETWKHNFERPLDYARTTRKPYSRDALPLVLHRLGFEEETYMTFTFLPLIDKAGEVVGFYHTCVDSTKQVVNERRLTNLLKISQLVASAKSQDSFWSLVNQALDSCRRDAPFALVYSLSDPYDIDMSGDDGPASPTTSSSQTLQLQGSLGYPSDHPLVLAKPPRAITDLFFAALRSRTATILQARDGTLPEALVRNLAQRGDLQQCDTVALCPVRPTDNDQQQGLMVLGLSNKRPFDDDYLLFVELLMQSISSLSASVLLLEDEKRLGRSAEERAVYERKQLMTALKQRELENAEQEHRFRLVADYAPVSLFECTMEGDIVYCNKTWRDLMSCHEPKVTFATCLAGIHEHDRSLIAEKMEDIRRDRREVVFEVRMAKSWDMPSGVDGDPSLDHCWALTTAFPVIRRDGTLKSIIGSLTDISLQKYTLRKQKQRTDDMIEAKRQQENFVDMTSHEMRNPLNAMLLCAQELHENVSEMEKWTGPDEAAKKEQWAGCMETIETILYCGRHQKRIIDDILVLSKMDAKLLQIQPIETQPVNLVEDTLRLFDSEVRAQGIETRLAILQSYADLTVTSVLLDPSRVCQILVNFIANAIKFTKSESKRQLTVALGASRTRPTNETLKHLDIQLVREASSHSDLTEHEHWGDGEPLYIEFEVRDTGPGITSEDIIKLFNRFCQTTPKTHAHYGGSGLGLFISQQLAELQGGMVGIASKPGSGSSFYFFIKCRRASKPTIGQHIVSATTQTLTHLDPRRPPLKRLPSATTHVLIVEDNIVNQRVLKKQLDKAGYRTTVANHGGEALDVVQRSTSRARKRSFSDDISKPRPLPLDIILMDIEMPVMDGRACVAQIRKWESEGNLGSHIPVIALTANARPEQIIDAKAQGFDDVLSKPYAITDVLTQIERFTE